MVLTWLSLHHDSMGLVGWEVHLCEPSKSLGSFHESQGDVEHKSWKLHSFKILFSCQRYSLLSPLVKQEKCGWNRYKVPGITDLKCSLQFIEVNRACHAWTGLVRVSLCFGYPSTFKHTRGPGLTDSISSCFQPINQNCWDILSLFLPLLWLQLQYCFIRSHSYRTGSLWSMG